MRIRLAACRLRVIQRIFDCSTRRAPLSSRGAVSRVYREVEKLRKVNTSLLSHSNTRQKIKYLEKLKVRSHRADLSTRCPAAPASCCHTPRSRFEV